MRKGRRVYEVALQGVTVQGGKRVVRGQEGGEKVVRGGSESAHKSQIRMSSITHNSTERGKGQIYDR